MTATQGRLLAIASGKGGVGKTWLAITLAHAVARDGRRVLLFDADLGLANVDIQLGLVPDRDLASVLRAAAETLGAAETTPEALATADLSALDDAQELALIRRLIAWPRLIEGAALAREPHRVAFFLYDLAGEFHMLWNKGRDDSTLRFLQADDAAGTRARLALVAATATVIRSGLTVMGVTPVEEMR